MVEERGLVELLPGMQQCPGCGYGTIRVSGCDHITCVVCEAHWCFRCGVECDEGDIYEHLAVCRGGS